VLASIVCYSALGSRAVVHEILIGVFITVTTPVTLMLLARAARGLAFQATLRCLEEAGVSD
jgi:multisubunit Na+/H+ antiporter MnhG subunit